MFHALIVEDESLLREYLMLNLNNIHNQWRADDGVQDGIEAVELLQKKRFDLVITDIKMPRMGGLELADHIRHSTPDTDVILLTGYDEFAFARAAIRVGVADYLLKPLCDSELHSILDCLASKHIGQGGDADQQVDGIPDENQKAEISVTDRNANILIRRVRNYIERHYCEQISLNSVAGVMNVNPAYLSSAFESERGESYSKYVLRLRMEHAALLLQTHAAGNINSIATDVGYLSAKHFYFCF